VQPIPGVEEVNMFQENGNVLHFTAPKGKFSTQNQSFGNQVPLRGRDD